VNHPENPESALDDLLACRQPVVSWLGIKNIFDEKTIFARNEPVTATVTEWKN
jgi:hypothetical protein